MDNAPKLAIVIPAYKISFFKQTMESIANQTCKDFILYIGDDASPSNLIDIVDSFRGQLNIVYKRFEKNLGGENLVSHWNRCIDMIQNEEWIWFFSDDDLMEHTCVELFYQHITAHKKHVFLHFDIKVINGNGLQLYKIRKFPPHMSTVDFFSKRITGKIYSCAVEYIFKRSVFEHVNRFESFDLAWSTDEATWLKLSTFSGINTIDGAFVQWRYSTVNISSIDEKSIVLRKISANINYLNWVKQFFHQQNLIDITSEVERAKWLTSIIAGTSSLSYTEKYKLIISSLRTIQLSRLSQKLLSISLLRILKKNIKSIIYLKK